MNYSENEFENWSNVNVPEKPSFFAKHKFVIGLFTGVACMLLLLFGGFQVLKMSGQFFVIGGTGIHEVDNTPLLDEATVNKLTEIYEWMKIYYYVEKDKEIMCYV